MTKNYPVIIHNGHILVVDKEDELLGSMEPFSDEEMREWAPNNKGTWYKIIAASPEAKLEGVPVIEIEEDVDDLALQSVGIYQDNVPQWEDFITDKDRSKAIGFKKGYKAAKAKQYTEEDMKTAIVRAVQWYTGGKQGADNLYEYIPQYIASLQKPIKSVDLEMDVRVWIIGDDDEPRIEDRWERAEGEAAALFFQRIKLIDNYVIIKQIYYE